MYKSIILPLAKEDIREAAIWYNKKSQELGKRFTSEVREKVRFIKQNPTASNIRYEDVRTAVLISSHTWFIIPLTKLIKRWLFLLCYIQAVTRNCGIQDKNQ
jgi:hypothetical protein